MLLYLPSMKKSTSKGAEKEKARLVVNDQSKHFSFFQNVWDVVRHVPKGRVTSYGAIAKYLGTGSSARMVGWAMNGAHGIKPKVPAHRVVNRNGMLSGKMHFATPDLMEELLNKEGIYIENDIIKNFHEIFCGQRFRYSRI